MIAPILFEIAGILMLAGGGAMLIASAGCALDVRLMNNPRYWKIQAQQKQEKSVRGAANGILTVAYFAVEAGIEPQKIIDALMDEIQFFRAEKEGSE